MTAREYKAIAHENAQGGRYDRAQVYATLYLAEQVAELVKQIGTPRVMVGTSAERATYSREPG